jgi:hypothetical protein
MQTHFLYLKEILPVELVALITKNIIESMSWTEYGRLYQLVCDKSKNIEINLVLRKGEKWWEGIWII